MGLLIYFSGVITNLLLIKVYTVISKDKPDRFISAAYLCISCLSWAAVALTLSSLMLWVLTTLLFKCLN